MPKSSRLRTTGQAPGIGSGTVAVMARVLELLNLTDTARELGVTQPAVSFHIAKFERHFGYQVLRRAGNALVRTPEGDRAFALCRAIMDDFGQLEAIGRAPRAEPKIGLPPSLLQSLAEDSWSHPLMERYQFVADPASDTEKAFRQREFGMLVHYLRPNSEKPQVLSKVEMAWTGDAALLNEALIPIGAFPESTIYGAMLPHYCPEAIGITRVFIRSPNFSNMEALVRQGRILTYCPRLFLEKMGLPILENPRLPSFTVPIGFDHHADIVPLRDFEAITVRINSYIAGELLAS